MWGFRKKTKKKKAAARTIVKSGSYCGPERRRVVRRKQGDRRTAVRWEPGDEPRRQDEGRRVTDTRFLDR